MKINYAKLVVALVACLAAGAIGSIFTAGAIPNWYAALNKPDLAPPNWVFAPVWTTLYILMGIAAYLVWDKGWKNKDVKVALDLFGAQLVLNIFWSIIFFGMKNPLYAFIEIIVLWLAIALTISKFNKIEKNAAYLMVPYIIWVSFAAYLNYSIWMLNP